MYRPIKISFLFNRLCVWIFCNPINNTFDLFESAGELAFTNEISRRRTTKSHWRRQHNPRPEAAYDDGDDDDSRMRIIMSILRQHAHSTCGHVGRAWGEGCMVGEAG